MATYGNPKENKVCVNWLGKNEKCTRYFRKFKGKTLSFTGSSDTRKEAEAVKKFRKDKYDRDSLIIKLGGEYLSYSH